MIDLTPTQTGVYSICQLVAKQEPQIKVAEMIKILAFVLVYFVIMKWVLPRLGVPT